MFRPKIKGGNKPGFGIRLNITFTKVEAPSLIVRLIPFLYNNAVYLARVGGLCFCSPTLKGEGLKLVTKNWYESASTDRKTVANYHPVQSVPKWLLLPGEV